MSNHNKTRNKQKENSDEVHHPLEKTEQIIRIINKYKDELPPKLDILELFSGQGNLTKIYKEFGEVYSYDKKYENTGDSYLIYHKLISNRNIYEIIDLDPYGFPNRFFPDIYLLFEKGILFVTMPKPSVNILNGITQEHLISYYGEYNPSKETIINRIEKFGICHWRKVKLIDCIDLKSIWRMAFLVEKVKATEYTGVNNH